MIKKFIKIFCLNLILILPLNAKEVRVFEFTNQELESLKVKKVRGADNKTIYTVGSNENGNFLKANSENAASGLGKEIKIDLNVTPFINIPVLINNYYFTQNVR